MTMFISSVLAKLQWRMRRGEVARSLQKLVAIEQSPNQFSLFGNSGIDPAFVDVVMDVLDLMHSPAEDETDHRDLWDAATQKLLESQDFKQQMVDAPQLEMKEAEQAEELIRNLPPPTWSDQDVFALHEYMLVRALEVIRSPKSTAEALEEIHNWMDREETHKVPFSFEACCACIPCDPEITRELIKLAAKQKADIKVADIPRSNVVELPKSKRRAVHALAA